MADASLQDRLRDHAKAFDGLLSLIPAKIYYGEDTSDQWQRKKQSKAAAKAAKRGRLDPDSELNRNAKEVMDERARNKRKLREMEDDEDEVDGDDDGDRPLTERERPGEGMKRKKSTDSEPNKKKKVSAEDEDSAVVDERKTAKEERRLAKKQKKSEKKRLKVEEEAESSAKAAVQSEKASEPDEKEEVSQSSNSKTSQTAKSDPLVSAEADTVAGPEIGGDMEPMDVAGLVTKEDEVDERQASDSSGPSSSPGSPVFDAAQPEPNAPAEVASTTTSVSSIIPPSERPKHIKIPADTTALRIRLAAKIEALRAARKADGAGGKPIRTRQELIESRREKEAQRKAHKKEMRKLAKEEEDRKREEALASARESPGGALSPRVGLDDDSGASNHFAFGRVAFADGTQMSHDLSYAKEAAKKKGPSDAKTALTKLEAQKKRLSGLTEDKRKEVLEKETWLAARRRAEGEKIHDDESLLKKTIKRKEKAKKKSEREWTARKEGVEKSIKDRQQKRESNIRKRKDDKRAGKAGKKKGATKKNRPGFEGRFGGGTRR